MINGAGAPSHMALDANTFNAVVKVISKQPWDEANAIMQGLLAAKPVALDAKKPESLEVKQPA